MPVHTLEIGGEGVTGGGGGPEEQAAVREGKIGKAKTTKVFKERRG